MSKIYGYCRVSTRKQVLKRQENAIEELYPGAIIITDSTTGRNFDRPGWTKLYKQLQPGDTIVFDEVSRMSRDAEEGFEIYQELFQKGVNLIFIAEPHINTETFKKAIENVVPMTGTNVDYILEGINKYLLSLAKEQIRLAFEKSQSEVDNNSRRTSKALKTKQQRNEELKVLHPDDYQDQPDFRQIGQPKGIKLTTKKEIALKGLIVKHNKDFQGNLSDAETISLINGMNEIRTADGKILNPHVGVTKTGNQLNRYLNRATFYKYKRELKTPYQISAKVEAFRERLERIKENDMEREIERRYEYLIRRIEGTENDTTKRRDQLRNKAERETRKEFKADIDRQVEEYRKELEKEQNEE